MGFGEDVGGLPRFTEEEAGGGFGDQDRVRRVGDVRVVGVLAPLEVVLLRVPLRTVERIIARLHRAYEKLARRRPVVREHVEERVERTVRAVFAYQEAVVVRVEGQSLDVNCQHQPTGKRPEEPAYLRTASEAQGQRQIRRHHVVTDHIAAVRLQYGQLFEPQARTPDRVVVAPIVRPLGQVPEDLALLRIDVVRIDPLVAAWKEDPIRLREDLVVVLVRPVRQDGQHSPSRLPDPVHVARRNHVSVRRELGLHFGVDRARSGDRIRVLAEDADHGAEIS